MSWASFLAPEIKLTASEAETHALGFPVARLAIGSGAAVSKEGLEGLLADALKNYQLIIARWASNLESVPSILAATALVQNYELIPCPTLLYWSIDLTDLAKSPMAGTESSTVRANAKVSITADSELISSLISRTFHNYPSHYTYNRHLPANTTELAYIDWANRLHSTAGADFLIVNTENDQPAGIAMTSEIGDGTTEIGDGTTEVLLAGIANEFQRQGLYPQLFDAICQRAREKGNSRLVISTQASNLAVQRVWARAGLTPTQSVENCHLFGGTITR